MKHFHTICIISLILCSCNFSQDVETPGNEVSERQTDLMNDFMMGRGITFHNDFIIQSKDHDSKVKIDNENMPWVHAAQIKDLKQLEASYFAVKPKLIEWDQKAFQNMNTLLIQAVGLRYLRNLFLNMDDQNAINETLFLMDLLRRNGAVDLDVLADGFIKIKNELNQEKRSIYREYIHDLYVNNLNLLQDSNNNTSDENGTIIENNNKRLKNTCIYVAEVMKFEFNTIKQE